MTDALITESLALSNASASVAQTPIARGEVATWLLTLAGAGSIAGATLAASIRKRGSVQVLLTPTPTVSDATNRIIDLTLTAAQTLSLVGSPNQPQGTVRHVCDVTVTIGGVAGVFGPLVVDVRSPA